MSAAATKKRQRAAKPQPASTEQNGERLPRGSRRRARFLSRLQEARVLKQQLQQLEAELVASESARVANAHDPRTERMPGLPPASDGEVVVGEDRFLSYAQNEAQILEQIDRIEKANEDLMPLVDQLCADEEQEERLQHATRAGRE